MAIRNARARQRFERHGELLRRGRRAFVEPEIFPPGHDDVIAKPLMRHFMRDDGKDAAPLDRFNAAKREALGIWSQFD